MMDQWNFNWSILVYFNKFINLDQYWDKVFDCDKFLDWDWFVNKFFNFNCFYYFVSLCYYFFNKSVNWNNLFDFNIVQDNFLFE